jgi:uncharacterized protein YqjF (DUF2071 family)
MIHRWDAMTFLHWRYDPRVLQPLLPDGLRAETCEGSAWVSLLPFRMRIRFPGVPMQWITFPETNVRTYVAGPDGGSGIFFFSLEAGRPTPVAAARASLSLPYAWADMAVRRDGDSLRYRSARRIPGPRGAGHDIAVRWGEPIGGERLPALDDFLVNRFRLYTWKMGRLIRVDAEHEPWVLRSAEILELRQDLVEADGLPSPQGEPIVHASEGVEVRIGVPAIVR